MKAGFQAAGLVLMAALMLSGCGANERGSVGTDASDMEWNSNSSYMEAADSGYDYEEQEIGRDISGQALPRRSPRK